MSNEFVTVKREVLEQVIEKAEAATKHFNIERIGESTYKDTNTRCELHEAVNKLRAALDQPGVEPQQLKSPCARQCEAQAFKIEIRQLTRLVADYMEIIAKQRVAMKEAHRVLGTLDVSITSRTLGARCGLAEAMELGISAPQPAQQPEADKLLRQALEAMEVQGSEWVILEQNALSAIRKYLGEA